MSKKLLDPAASVKTYWSMLKKFLNNKKTPCVPLLFYQNKYVIDFREMAELFNSFFADQYFIIKNSSKFPCFFFFLNKKAISSGNFKRNVILKII